MIASNTFLSKVTGKRLRQYLLDKVDIVSILSLGQHAFGEPTVETVIIILKKRAGRPSPTVHTQIGS